MATTRLLATMAMVMGCAVAGCVHTGFTATTSMVVPARAPTCYLDVFFQEQPPYPYVVLGPVGTSSAAPEMFALGENDIVTMRRMMEQACAVGAHGLLHAGESTQFVRMGKGYWKRTSGSAIAFVYVDAYGRPLPPPTGPRVQ
jgi:hypothetical protein